MARRPKLTNSELAYAQRCDRISSRVLRRTGRKAVALKLGLSVSCLSKYLSGQTVTIEQHEVMYPKINTREAQ